MSVISPTPAPYRRPDLPLAIALRRSLDRVLARGAAPDATDEERAAARRITALLKARGRWQEAPQQ